MAPFPIRKAANNDSAGRPSFVDLQRKLDAGWTIEQPVYVMADPGHRERLVFRLMLWHDGRPQVVTVRDGADIRQFLANRHLTQESL